MSRFPFYFVCLLSVNAWGDVGGSCLSRNETVVISHTGRPPFGRLHMYETKLIFKPVTASFILETNYSTSGISVPEKFDYSYDTLSRTKISDNLVFPGQEADVSSVYSEGKVFIERLLTITNQLTQVSTMLRGTPSEMEQWRGALECAVYRLGEIQQKATMDVLRHQNIKLK